ncbi:MAG: HAD-IA family hydrolase [Acidobacteria bacterium]|nr:HAD-IA family hydrolase [Acidobacteriota bacterium]
MTPPALDPRRLRVFIFDLDGTLIDSKLDLAHSVNATREHFGLGTLPHDTIFSFIGDGARTLIQRALAEGASEEQIEPGLAFFLQYYREHMLDNTVTYPGVREALERLAGEHRVLTVLTNKPVRFSRAILDGLGLGDCFRLVYGGNSFERKKPDPIGVQTTLREVQAAPEEAIMVGDSPTDVLTARNAGAWVCGVTYGLGSHLLDRRALDLCVDSLTELASWVGR